MSTITKKGAMHSPPHPGTILSELYLKPLRVTIAETARAMAVTPKHVSGIVNGRARVTANMTLRLAKALDTEAGLLVKLQAQHDLWVASLESPIHVKPLRQAA